MHQVTESKTDIRNDNNNVLDNCTTDLVSKYGINCIMCTKTMKIIPGRYSEHPAQKTISNTSFSNLILPTIEPGTFTYLVVPVV